MKIVLVLAMIVLSVGACVAQSQSETFIRDVYALDPNGPQTEVILKGYPPIKPQDVRVHFNYSYDCKKLQDIGVLIGWGDKGQARGDIIHDFQKRAAKYGANLVVYVGTISGIEGMDEVLHRRSEYSLMRCP